MSRRDNASVRCARCQMHAGLCVCALVTRVETRTRVVLLIHRLEHRKTSNTGRLALECLPNSELRLHGRREDPTPPLEADPGRQTVLLFPHEDALPLERLAGTGRPVRLVVPDGTWRQASKMRRRVPGLRDLPCAWLPQGQPSVYRLRAEAHGHGLATLEAIARALGVLGEGDAQAALERVFLAMVGRTLWARGLIEAADVPGGLPPGAERHAPLSGLGVG